MNAVEAILAQVGRDITSLSGTAVDALKPVLAEAERELKRDLAKWLATVPDGAERFTAQMYRNALVQIRGALGTVNGMKPGIESGLKTGLEIAGPMALGHLEAQLLAFSSYFGDTIRPLPIHQAAIVAEGKDLLWPRYHNSAARYAGQVGTDIRTQLALGVTRGETIDELTKRLIRHGGPKGLVALRGIVGAPNHYAEMISEGLFVRYGHWAERLARTEVIQAYNVHTDRGLREWADQDDGALSRWDAALDFRVCAICRELHDRTVEVGGAFPGGYRFPPAHPRCRCALTAWNKRWGKPSETIAAPVGPTPPLIEAPAKPAPALPIPKFSTTIDPPAPALPQPKFSVDILPPAPALPVPKFSTQVTKPAPKPRKPRQSFTPDPVRPAGGSQGGMWFKDETGAYWFGKHYHGDLDRMGSEHLTNQIYRKLGVSAPETKIVKVKGKSWLMSKELSGAQGKELLLQSDVLDGFIYDAWLANWDVVGLSFDNVLVEGQIAHRIDNGGALVWRAQGARKPFTAASFGELDSLRDPRYPAGQIFSKLSDKDVLDQIKKFEKQWKTKAAAIEKLVGKAGISDNIADEIRRGLRERAEWLFGEGRARLQARLPQPVKKGKAIKRGPLGARIGPADFGPEVSSFHGVAVDADGSFVDNQSINVRKVVGADGQRYHEVTFKLNEQHGQALAGRLERAGAVEGDWAFRARELRLGVVHDKTTQPQTLYGIKGVKLGNVELGRDGAVRNMVRVRVVGDDVAAALAEVEKIGKDLGGDLMSRPTASDIKTMARAKIAAKVVPGQYAEMIKNLAPGDDLAAAVENFWPQVKTWAPPGIDLDAIVDSVEVREVAPGQRGLYSKKLAETLRKDGGITTLYHTTGAEIEHVADMIERGALASLARYDRGVFTQGMSTSSDFGTGGADGFFVRAGRRRSLHGSTQFEFSQDELGRLDWWAFNHDNYGAAGTNAYKSRWKLADLTRRDSMISDGNEFMLPKGILPSQIEKVRLRSKYDRDKLLDTLRRRGITHVNGQRIEDFVQES